MSEHKLPRKIGKYEVIGLLGTGAMGAVYKAVDPTIGRTVAVKTIRAFQGKDQTQEVEFFLREARSAGNLHHSNIVFIYEDIKKL